MSEALIARWLDDRASLDEDEVRELEAALRADPGLAQQVKEQLLTDDLLSRRLALDRSRFETQVAQRVAAAGSEGAFTQSTLEALRRDDRRRSLRVRLPEAAAAGLLLAGLMVLLLRGERTEVPGAARPVGLEGRYYRNTNLKGASTTRIDPALDFTWTKGSGPLAGWGEVFSARLTGRIQPQFSERYRIRTLNDDGVRVWIGGTLVIDDWKGRPVVMENRGEIALESGRSYDLKVEYFNGGDLGVMRLFWSSVSQKEEIIPVLLK
ncbi:MAG: hypothetical protein HY293_09870 [Planctomycetes bacterium]|nr:hypothetical protein [Planctomycetota bacterium]